MRRGNVDSDAPLSRVRAVAEVSGARQRNGNVDMGVSKKGGNGRRRERDSPKTSYYQHGSHFLEESRCLLRISGHTLIVLLWKRNSFSRSNIVKHIACVENFQTYPNRSLPTLCLHVKTPSLYSMVACKAQLFVSVLFYFFCSARIQPGRALFFKKLFTPFCFAYVSDHVVHFFLHTNS